MDRISQLPDNIVETIMLCLPLRDAVRTSILSREWQYKWTTLSLSLDRAFYDTVYGDQKAPEITYPGLVKTILLQHIGHLQKVVIYIPDLTPSGNGYIEDINVGDINLTLRIALVNGIEELIVEGVESVPHALPSFLFSSGDDYMLCSFNNLGKIKYLSLGGYMCRLLGGDCVPRKQSTEVGNLKTNEANSLALGHKREFHCLLCLIRSSPNLQLLDIAVNENISGEVDQLCDAVEYVGWCFQHLQAVRINDLKGTKSKLKIIEVLFACSPVLKVLSVKVESHIDKYSKLKLYGKLLRFLRLSPKAVIACRKD